MTLSIAFIWSVLVMSLFLICISIDIIYEKYLKSFKERNNLKPEDNDNE